MASGLTNWNVHSCGFSMTPSTVVKMERTTRPMMMLHFPVLLLVCSSWQCGMVRTSGVGTWFTTQRTAQRITYILGLGHDGPVSVAYSGAVSKREAEVLALVGAQLSNAEIADHLHLSVRTVENHVSSLLRKCGVANRRELSRLARQGSAEQRGIAGLPAPLTTFIGRETERERLLEALRAARLVT